MGSAPPYCPSCGQLDPVRKVTAIVDAEQHDSFGPAGPSFSRSRLADRLRPPAPPPYRGCLLGCLGVTVVALGCLILSAVFIGAGQLIDRGSWWSLLVPLSFWICGNAGLLLAHRRQQQRSAVERAIWQAEVRAWAQQYYCGRCDDTVVPLPAAMQSYTGQTVRIVP